MAKGPLTSVLDSLLEELKSGVKEKRSTLEDRWPEIVGPSMARHTRARLLRKGTLCIWVDDSVLAYDLGRRHEGTILKKTREILGEETVKKLIFRVGEIQ